MQSFELLLQRYPLIFFHLVTAFGALVVGIVIMTRRKGTVSHRWWGWSYVVFFGACVLAGIFTLLTGWAKPHLLEENTGRTR